MLEDNLIFKLYKFKKICLKSMISINVNLIFPSYLLTNPKQIMDSK